MTTKPWATAYHEAGHAVAARALGLVVTRVTIEPRYDTFYRKWRIGTTEIAVIGNHATDYSGEMRDRLRREAIFSLAGNAVERRAFDRPLLEEDHTDSDVAEWLLSRDTPQRDLPRVLRRVQATAESHLEHLPVASGLGPGEPAEHRQLLEVRPRGGLLVSQQPLSYPKPPTPAATGSPATLAPVRRLHWQRTARLQWKIA